MRDNIKKISDSIATFSSFKVIVTKYQGNCSKAIVWGINLIWLIDAVTGISVTPVHQNNWLNFNKALPGIPLNSQEIWTILNNFC